MWLDSPHPSEAEYVFGILDDVRASMPAEDFRRLLDHLEQGPAPLLQQLADPARMRELIVQYRNRFNPNAAPWSP